MITDPEKNLPPLADFAENIGNFALDKFSISDFEYIEQLLEKNKHLHETYSFGFEFFKSQYRKYARIEFSIHIANEKTEVFELFEAASIDSVLLKYRAWLTDHQKECQ